MIPKAANEIVFALGIFGLLFLYLEKKGDLYIRIALSVVLWMIIWRVAYRIQSSRYACAFVYPFSIFAALFLSRLAKSKYIINGVICFFIGICVLINWTNKNYNIKQINSNLKIIAELHDKVNARENHWTLITSADDAGRIGRMEKEKHWIEIYYSEKSTGDVGAYIRNYRSISKNILFNISLRSSAPDTIRQDSTTSNYKHILSIYTQQNKKKRENIYAIKSKAQYSVLSKNKTIMPESGILNNGDLEQIDSPEDSFAKLNKHIGNYSLFFGFDESKRTPINAYFYNNTAHTEFLPNYNCLNDFSLSGAHSAFFDIKKGYGYIMFNQKFQSGTYQYSFVFSGKNNSSVCLLYDLYQNNKWHVVPLATYTISDKSIVQISSQFTVSDFGAGDFFLVGAWVNGEAYLDNFCLKKIDN